MTESNGMPRVCIYQRFLPPDPSGAGKQAVTLARVIREAGCEVVLLTDEIAGGAADERLAGFEVHRVTPPPPEPTYREILAYWGRVGRKLADLRNRFDVLQVHTADFHHVGAIPAARLLGKPALVRSTLTGEFAHLSKWRGGKLQKRLMLLAGAFVVLSKRLAAEYEQSGFPVNRLHLIPNGVDAELYRPASREEKHRLRKELNLPERGRILIYHGVFIERKSLHWLVDVLEPHLEELDLTLVLVGGPAREEPTTGYAAALKARIAASSASGRIIVREHQPAIHRYLQASDAYILASTGEGLPNALLEAMSVGLVPFVSRTSGSEDVVGDPTCGFLFEPRDAASLLRCLRTAFDPSDPSVLESVSRAATERIRTQYSISRTGAAYIETYRRLLSGTATVRNAA